MSDDDLTQRLQRLERLTAGSRDGYWERDLVTDASWYSPTFRRMLGFAPEALPDDRNVVNARMHADDRDEFLRRYQQAIDTVGQFDYELRYLDGTDQWRWLRGRGQAWPGADGRTRWITGAVSDVQAEKQAQQSLEAANRRFERAIEASAEGLFERIVGEEAVYMSDRYLELIGNRRDEVPPLRSAILPRFHPEDAAHALAAIAAGEASLQRWELTLRFRHGSGEYRWYRQRCLAERMPDGRVKVTGMIADVHEQVLQQQELEQTRSHLEALVAERTASLEAALALAHQRQLEAERANAAKSRFLAHMSHEIRTPLNGVLGLVDLALRVAQLPEQQRYLETARRSGQTLAEVINTVLDFSRIEAGHAELRPRPFDMAQAVVDTIRNVIPMMRARGVLVLFDWTDGPYRLVGDEVAIRQIITNLVGNAAKFTERGAITVIGHARPAAPGGPLEMALSILDTGPGVPAAWRQRIFDAFVQADDSLTRSHGGTGLGLSIARGLAKAMGGDIELDEPAQGGSRFTLRLPLPAAPGAPVVPHDDDPATRQLGMAWMVATSPTGSEWLMKRLRRIGWQTRVLASVDDAIAACQRGEPVQLLMLSEFGLAQSSNLAPLRATMPSVPIRLFVRPDWHAPALEAQAQALGMVTITTPLAPDDLDQLQHTPAPAIASPPPDTRWCSNTEVLLVEDNPVNQLIGQEYLRTLGLSVHTVADGAQAVQACVDRPPALVLMDLQMPGMDGFEATRQLRQLQQQGRWPGAPIVALTAHAGASDHDACLDAGMDGVLTKPLTLDQLREQLAHYLPAPSAAG